MSTSTSGSFTSYFNRNNELLKTQRYEEAMKFENYKLHELTANNERTKNQKLIKKIKKTEEKIVNLQQEIERRNFLSATPDELVKEYLLHLPANRKRIDLSDMFEDHSLTTVPDLSRFAELIHLDLSCNRHLSSGFDRLPTTLKKLVCFKTDIPNEDTAWILRLVNLESLYLCRNDRIRVLPDLSSLKNMKDLNISQLELKQCPNLPLNTITTLIVSIEGLPRNYNRPVYCIRKYQKTLEFITKSQATQIIHHINRVNQFDKIRDELLENGAKIVLLPSRIKRLLDQSEIDLDSDWSDIYEFQSRRKQTV